MPLPHKIEVRSYEDHHRGRLSIDIIVDDCVVQTITVPTNQLFLCRDLMAQAARMSIALKDKAQ